MKARKLLDVIITAERLKGTIRYCFTSTNRPESVAEYFWMAVLMAYFMRDEFPEADMDKVIKMKNISSI
jgi:putative hydrolase of HD superfamily